MPETCRKILEYYMDEYKAFGEKCILGRPFCFKTMLIAKKAAKMVQNAHEAYHIAIELEHKTERDWHGEYIHDYVQMPDHGMPAARTVAHDKPAARVSLPDKS